MTDRRRQASSPRIVVVWIVVLLVAFAVVVGSTATARSQVAVYYGSLPDGTYSGGIYFHMGSAELNLQGAGGAGELVTSLDSAGKATLVVDTNVPSISGKWNLAGTGDLRGSFSMNGKTLTASGATTFDGKGGFSGTYLKGRLTGSASSQGEWNFDGGLSTLGPFPAGGPMSFDEPLTDLTNECSQVLGKWGSQVAKKLQAKNPQMRVTRVHAYFVLSDEVVITQETPIADRLRDVAKRANSALGEARGGGEALTAVAGGAELLRDVEKLQADIAAKESDCPTDKGFQNALTQVAQDALDTSLEGFENDPTIEPTADILRYMVRLGDGTAATGSGAQDTVRAGELDGRMETQANQAFNEATQSYSDGNDAALNEAVSLAALGEQQGWGLENSAGITGSDVLAVTGN